MATSPFPYTPDEYEAEKASNSYLMSLVALMAGLPLPIVNLIASVMFFLANRRSAHFVKWHCTQAVLIQALTLVMNAAGVYWTISIVFGPNSITNPYLSYIITVIAFNLVEFVATIYSAVQTRKGRHVSWWFFGPLTDMLVRG